jgi:hypothetical protein
VQLQIANLQATTSKLQLQLSCNRDVSEKFMEKHTVLTDWLTLCKLHSTQCYVMTVSHGKLP